MSAEKAVIQLLLGSSTVTNLVGNKVFPQSIEQGVKIPALVVTRISGAPLYADDGEVGLSSPRIQIDCYAKTYTETKALADIVRTLLSAFDGTVGGTVIQFATLEDERDDREAATASEFPFRIIQDFIVWIEG